MTSKGKHHRQIGPIGSAEARALFAPWADVPAIILAVSGGPDSMALMMLAARWRSARKTGPQLSVVTVDHGLRPEAAREAALVKRAARALGLPHRTVRWTGVKPTTAIQAAARRARYGLLAAVATRSAQKPAVIFTAHTRDDQAETVLMRMARGSGVAGLAAMLPVASHEGMMVARPLLTVAKERLIATLARENVAFVDDRSNRDPAFTRVRLRRLMPQLAAEGLDSSCLTRLANRLARANAALEAVTATAAAALVRRQAQGIAIDLQGYRLLPHEIRLRLLGAAFAALAREGDIELAKLEALVAALDDHLLTPRPAVRFRRSLAGAMVTADRAGLRVEPAPARKKTRSDATMPSGPARRTVAQGR